MATIKIAVPTEESGIDAKICPHFGHAKMFVLVDVDDQTKEIKKVDKLVNPPHEQGGCIRPVMLLKDQGITAIILTGIGGRPLMGFIQNNVLVFQGIDGTVSQNITAMLEKKLPQVTQSLCNHH